MHARLLALLILLPSLAAAQPCERVLTPRIAQRLHDHLVAIETAACPLDSTRTEVSVMTTSWLGGAEQVVFAPTGCLDAPTVEGAVLAVSASESFAASCPGPWASIRDELTGQQELVAPHPVAAKMTEGGTTLRSVITRGLLALWLLLALVLAARGLWRRPPRRQLAALVAVALLGLAVRWGVEPTMANWYVPVLGPDGPYEGRFGQLAYELQAALRATLPWSLDLWTTFNVALGVATLPLTVALGAELGLGAWGLGAAAALLALSPYHARLSASPGTHVLASTLLVTGLWAWQRALGRRDAALAALALLSMAAAMFTRANVLGFALLLPLFGLAARSGSTQWGRRATAAGYAALVPLAGLTWWLVVVPSKHPRPPLGKIVRATRHALPQLVDLASRKPHWVAGVTVVLALLGLIGGLVERRRAPLAITLLFVGAFASVGRDMDRDELLSARYFGAALPLLALVAGWGFDMLRRLLLRWEPLAARPAWTGAGLLLAALTLRGWPAEALQHRYTFQDEYSFLLQAASGLPEGCVVYQVPARLPDDEGDLDCCLWASRSPLPLALPQLRFADLPADPARYADALGSNDCAAWYRGAQCSLRATSPMGQRRAKAI